ncbi:MAG TPA: hypothetical protein VNM40_00705 [Candidatus Paceibacterota bacterium]|nr:hypothetical protein [Candidatus Paceibacterota bacterium]
MKLNRLEIAGIFSAVVLVILAGVFFAGQVVHADENLTPVDPCEDIFPSVPGMPGCDESGGGNDDESQGGNETPVDPCEDIFPNIPNMPECEGGDDGGSGGGETDLCPNDEGVQTSTPCPSDEDDEGSEGGSSGGGGSGSSGGGGGSGSGGSGGGSVLGASTGGGLSCEYLTGFIKPGSKNDFFQVARLQAFLKVFEGASVQVNGTYDAASIAAVHAFQTKYASEILTPWGVSRSTGYVYLTTRKKVNEIYCDRNFSFPLTEEEQQIIEHKKSAPTSVVRPAQPRVQPQAPAAPQQPETEEREEETPVVNTPTSSFTDFFRRLFERFR